MKRSTCSESKTRVDTMRTDVSFPGMCEYESGGFQGPIRISEKRAIVLKILDVIGKITVGVIVTCAILAVVLMGN